MNTDDVRLLDEFFSQNSAAANIARSYLAGATPHNGYTPSQPYTVVVIDNPYTYLDSNEAHLFVKCGGADNPRSLTMRKAGDGLWYLWDHSLLG